MAAEAFTQPERLRGRHVHNEHTRGKNPAAMPWHLQNAAGKGLPALTDVCVPVKLAQYSAT
jgi:hypothetical protein